MILKRWFNQAKVIHPKRVEGHQRGEVLCRKCILAQEEKLLVLRNRSCSAVREYLRRKRHSDPFPAEAFGSYSNSNEAGVRAHTPSQLKPITPRSPMTAEPCSPWLLSRHHPPDSLPSLSTSCGTEGRAAVRTLSPVQRGPWKSQALQQVAADLGNRSERLVH